eukprot:6197998-Pleurochrysis_carterae.AAC.1
MRAHAHRDWCIGNVSHERIRVGVSLLPGPLLYVPNAVQLRWLSRTFRVAHFAVLRTFGFRDPYSTFPTRVRS